MDENILNLIEKYPNNEELGKAVRELYYRQISQRDMILQQMEFTKNK
jgi:hypothetical protein